MTLPEGWRPLDVREGDASKTAKGPFEGVPEWMWHSLWEWIASELRPIRSTTSMGQRVHRPTLRRRTLREAERRLRFTTGWPGGDESKALGYVASAIKNDAQLTLRLTDFLVAKCASDIMAVERLDAILTEAGSAYSVSVDGPVPELQRRVDPTVESMSRAAMEADDDASTLLRAAWTAVLGVEPHPSDGYRNAVRAVEAAAVHVVLPTDNDATLGRVIGHLRATSSKWTLVLRGRDGRIESIDALLAMLDLLWSSQYDRHVTEGVPLHMTQPEAEAALPLAATLVNWFRSGVVQTSR